MPNMGGVRSNLRYGSSCSDTIHRSTEEGTNFAIVSVRNGVVEFAFLTPTRNKLHTSYQLWLTRRNGIKIPRKQRESSAIAVCSGREQQIFQSAADANMLLPEIRVERTRASRCVSRLKRWKME